MTHEEWLEELKNKHDRHGYGLVDYHWAVIRDKHLFGRHISESNNGWFIWEIAVREEK